MPMIITLPDSLIAKIAAGEVIERPAYAVKELLENAIDAGADTITVAIEDSGLKKIIVIDNGEGMSREDLELCFKPHTTSKLTTEEALHSIATLGFRGEALGSIAAISDLQIKSRMKVEAGGTVIEIKQGILQNISPIGCPPGTTVTVENLFANVPARKKFLKSEKTEFRRITDIISTFALAYPTINFQLTHNKKIVLDLPKREEVHDRIKLIVGETTFQHLLPLTFSEGYISLSGFIGKPTTGGEQPKQYLFINKRTVTDRLINLAVKEAFGTLLPASHAPTFVLFISLPNETIDVNIHPRKEQVSFVNNQLIFDAIRLAVTHTLSQHNLTISQVPWIDDISVRKSETQSIAGQILRESVLPWDRKSVGDIAKGDVLQLHQTYILTTVQDGLVLVDQHAAHERILYENFLLAFSQRRNRADNIQLKTPLTLTLSSKDAQILEEYLEQLTTYGFDLEYFQGNSYVVRKVPVVFAGRNIEKVITEMLSEFDQDKTPKSIDTRTHRMLAYLACRAAVKAGDVLSQKQMKTIIKQLASTANNATCPHGRPTKIAIALQDIHKYFRRS